MWTVCVCVCLWLETAITFCFHRWIKYQAIFFSFSLHSQIISPLQSIGITLRAFIWMLILDSCGKFL